MTTGDPSKEAPGSKPTSKFKQIVSSTPFRVGLSVVMVALVAYILSRDIKPAELQQAISHANPWWVVAAFVIAACAWIGAAIPLKSLANIHVPMTDATLVQVASSFVGVAAPMGLGPVAMHLDYLKRRGMDDASAVAVVAFIELSQFVTSAGLLLISLLVDHDFPHVGFPLKKVVLIAVGVAVLLIASLGIPKVRSLLRQKITQFWSQIQPQIKWVKQRPMDAVWAMAGVALQTLTTAMALMFAMNAVGHPISIFVAVTIYLIGNTLGAAVPTPGGIGSTLAATVAALHLVGVPTALAVSGVLIFRLVSFYLEVPIGWVAFTYMQRKNLL